MSIRSRKNAEQMSRWFFILLSVVVLYIFWRIIEPFVIILVTSAIAAIVVTPVERKLRELVKNRYVSSIIMTFVVFLVVVIPLSVAAVIMVQQAKDIVDSSLGEGGWLETFDLQSHQSFQLLPGFVQQEIMAVDIAQVTKDMASWFVENMSSIFSKTAQALLGTIIFFISLYYMLVDRERIYDQALLLSPFKDKLDEEIMHRIISTVRFVVFGALIIAMTQGILAAIGMTIFGVPGALIWGAVVVVAAEVPIFGTGLVLLPASAYLIITGHVYAGIGLLIWTAVGVGLVDNFLSPLLIRGKTHMHALLILISILGGLAWFGPVGFIIGPTVLAAVMVVIELYKSGILQVKG